MGAELVFEVTQEADGTYSGRAVGESIFTQGDSLEELHAMAMDAVGCHFHKDGTDRRVKLTFKIVSA